MFDDIDTLQTGGTAPKLQQSPEPAAPRPRPIQPMPLQSTGIFPGPAAPNPVPPPRSAPLPPRPAPPPNLPTAPLPEDIFSSADTIPTISGEPRAKPYTTAGIPTPIQAAPIPTFPREEPPNIAPLGYTERSQGAPMPPISLPEQGGGGFRKVIVFLLAALIVAFIGVGAYLVYRIIKTRANVDVVNQPIDSIENETPTPPVAEEVPAEVGVEEQPPDVEEEEEPEESETPPPPPQPIDTDNDGLTDLEELEFSSNPGFIDTDMDKLDDYSEVRIYHSDPVRRDTDGDGYDDGVEVQNGYSPTGTGKLTSE